MKVRIALGRERDPHPCCCAHAATARLLERAPLSRLRRVKKGDRHLARRFLAGDYVMGSEPVPLFSTRESQPRSHRAARDGRAANGQGAIDGGQLFCS